MSDVPPPPPGGSVPPPGSFPPPPPTLSPPPGYVGARDHRFAPVRGIAKALGILLIIFVPLQLIGIWAQIDLADKARQLLDDQISQSEFEEASQLNVGSLTGLVVIPIAVLTMILMFRMAKNLRVLGRTDATWAPGWAIGGWFCPPCAIYAIPWLMFRELWKGSDPDVAPGDPTWKSRPVAAIVNVWWVLYGLVPLIGLVTAANVVSNLQSLDAEDLAERIDDFLVVNVVLALVSAVTAVVYLVMVRQLTDRHVRSTGE